MKCVKLVFCMDYWYKEVQS